MNSNPLYLYEEVMLLALRNKKGTVATEFSEQAVAGALVGELLLTGHLRIASDKKHLIEVASRKPLGDAILDEALHTIDAASRRASLKAWISRLARTKKLRHRVALHLCERGILRATEDKILLIFTRKLYPEIDPRPEQEILARLKAAIFDGATPVDERTAMLISLAHGTDLLRANLGHKEIKAKKKHIETLAQNDAIGQATKEIIQALQTAVLVAVMVPIVISG